MIPDIGRRSITVLCLVRLGQSIPHIHSQRLWCHHYYGPNLATLCHLAHRAGRGGGGGVARMKTKGCCATRAQSFSTACGLSVCLCTTPR